MIKPLATPLDTEPFSANPVVLFIGVAPIMGAQWLSCRVLDSRPRGRGFEPHQGHCVGSLSKTHLS